MDLGSDKDLEDAERSVKDLAALDKLRAGFELFSRATGLNVGLLEHPGGEVLIEAGRGGICSEFHRSCPASRENCAKGSSRLIGSLDGSVGTAVATCECGLTDCAAPIIINGKYAADLVAGQFLLREADAERFKKQAALYGFDEGEYLKALAEVPVVPEEKVRDMAAFLGAVTSLVAEQGRRLADGAAAETSLRESAAGYRALFENANAAIFIADVRTETILDANRRAEWLTGRTRGELRGMDWAKLHPPDQAEYYTQLFREHALDGSSILPEALVERKDGTRLPVRISATVLELGGRKVIQGQFEDISARKRIETELKLSEQKYRDLTEAIPDLVWETDENGSYTYVSPRFKEILGYETGEAVGKSPFAFIAETGEGEELEGFGYCLLKKLPFRNIEHPSRHKDGRTRVLESSGNPFFDETGRYKGYKGLTRDITDRKRLEDEHEMKAMLLDSVKDAVFLHDLEGRIVYANEAAYAQLGYAEDAMSNMMFQRLLTPESAKEFARQTQYAVSRGKAVFESEHVRTDGGVMPAETQAHALELDGEKFVLRVVRDVSERKLTEKALKESEERFRVTFENAPLGMCLTDEKGKIQAANSALCSISGYSRGEILNHNFMEFIHPEEAGLTSEWLLSLLEGTHPVSGTVEHRYLGRADCVINMEISASVLRHAHGAPVGLIMALKDITGRKEAERAQRQLLKELEKTNAEISQFNSLIAHDLQEPLRMVRSYSQLLEKRLEGKLDPKGAEFFNYVMNGGKLMQKMLEDLMTYLHEGTNPEMLQDVDLNEVMAQVLSLLSSSICANQVTVACGKLPVIVADKAQMTHLLQNLVGNAIKFRGSAPPRVSVSCEAGENADVFSVADNGIGIAPQFLERVFKIFQRLHTREEYPGTGVGLALCRKIVENHGGRIWANSEPGKWTAISFSIPRRAGAAGERGNRNDGK